jgi:hypothetical protein
MLIDGGKGGGGNSDDFLKIAWSRVVPVSESAEWNSSD